MMLERQKEGIAKAKNEGKYRGRKPTAASMIERVESLLVDGFSKRKIARATGLSERTIYRLASPDKRL